MKQTIIAKLRLRTTTDQFAQLRSLQLAYREALNYVSRYAFEHGKMSNKVRLQEGTYEDLRVLYALPAQMACSIPRQVGATYKGLWTKLKKNAESRQAGITKKRYKGLDRPACYLSPTVTYQQGRDYSSQTCPKCGHTARANRPEKGLVFVCQNCQYMLHADLVGARNLVLRTLLARQDWARTGLLSVAPDTSYKEAKAARLSRYAELRWSPDASPSL